MEATSTARNNKNRYSPMGLGYVHGESATNDADPAALAAQLYPAPSFTYAREDFVAGYEMAKAAR